MTGQAKSRLREHESARTTWLRDLAEIPTSYGRLVYLAGLLNVNTGQYEHYGAHAGSAAEASRLLKRAHENTFKEWIRCPLERKKSDVESYIASINEIGRAELIDTWLRLTPYKNLVPGSIQGPERQKHISDFEAILGLLKNVYGVASPNPIS